MDEYNNKRAVGGAGSSRNNSSHAFRHNHEDSIIQYCSRPGCSTRHRAMGTSQIPNSEKHKSSKPAFLSTHNGPAAGEYSRTPTVFNVHKKPLKEIVSTSLQVRVTVENSARKVQLEDVGASTREEEMITLEMDSPSAGIQRMFPKPEDLESSFAKEFSINTTATTAECQVASCSRTQKPKTRSTRSGNQVVSSSSSFRHSVVQNGVDHYSHMVKHSLNQGADMQRHGLRNPSCSSISDVLPSGCSPSDAGRNKRTDIFRKRYTDGQSSARCGGTHESSNGQNLASPLSGSPGLHLSPFERSSPQSTSRSRNQFTSSDGVISMRNQRPESSSGRMLSENVDASAFLLPEPLIPHTLHPQFSPCEVTAASSSESFPTDLTPFHHSSSGVSASSRSAYPRLTDHSEDRNSRMFGGPWVDRDGFHYFNMDGISQVLLALERIEQHEEFTYEQLMALESNLFLNGTGFYDQHRDMRLDIDNMSYEELLALEEKMGTVSTALTEEALAKCLERSIYAPLLGSGIACSDCDIKCSVCQEEYIEGDEVGKLHCDHRYHVTCIHQWLRQKNWCPICKSSACPS